MIVKPNNTEFPVFDALAKPIGKKRFINRRELSAAAKPLLAEYHLPVFTPRRGKRCYSASYEKLFKTEISKTVYTQNSFNHEFTEYSLSYREKTSLENTFIPLSQKHYSTLRINEKNESIIHNYDKNYFNTFFELKENQNSKNIEHGKIFTATYYKIKPFNEYRYNFEQILYETDKTLNVLSNKSVICSIKSDLYNIKPLVLQNKAFFGFISQKNKKTSFLEKNAPQKQIKTNNVSFYLSDCNYVIDSGDLYVNDSANLLRESNFTSILKSGNILNYILSNSENIQKIIVPIINNFYLYIDNAFSKLQANAKHSYIYNIINKSYDEFASYAKLTKQSKFAFSVYSEKLLLNQEILNITHRSNNIFVTKKTEYLADTESVKKDRNSFAPAIISINKANFYKEDISFKFSSSKRNCEIKFDTDKNQYEETKSLMSISDYNLKNTTITKQIKIDFNFSKKQIIDKADYKQKKSPLRFICVSQAKYTFKKIKLLKIRQSFKKGINKTFGLFTINALRDTKQSNAVYSHIFKNNSKNKLNYSYISSIMCVLCEKAQLTKILKPEKIKYFRQKFGFEQNSKLNERNKCLNYNNLKKLSFPYSMPTLNSHKKIVSRKKTFDSKYLKISLNKIKNLISEKCDYSSYVKQVKKNIKKPVNTYCRTYKLRALTESLISKKMYFAPICSLPTKAIFKDYSFIIPEILDKSEKTVKVKMRLLPYPFGFPNFIHIKDKYVFFKSKKDFELKCNLDCKKQIFKNFNIYKEKKYRSPLSLREPRRFMFSKPGYSIFGSEIFVCDKQTNKQLFQNKVSKFKFYWQSKHYVISKVFGSLSPFTFRNRIRGQKTNFKIIDYKITSQSFYTNKPADMSKVKSSKICNFMISNINYKAKNQNGAYSVANKPYSNESFGIKGIKKLSLLKFQAKTTKFDLNVNKDYYLDILNPDKIHKKESVLFKATYRTFLAPYKATEYKNKELEEKRANIIEKHIYDINMFKSVINSFNFEIINKLEFKYKNYSDISFQSNYYTIFKFAAKYKWDNEQYKDIQCSNSSLEFNDSKILPLKYIDASKINYCLKSCFRSKTKSIKFSTEINRQLINYNSIKKLSTVPQIKTTKIKTFKQDCKHIDIKEDVDFHIVFIASETKPLNIFISSFNLYKNAYVSINLNKINQKMNQKVVELHNKFDTELESEFKNLAYKTNLDKVSNIKANSFAEKISDFRQSYHEPGIPDWIDIDLISRRNIRLLSLHS